MSRARELLATLAVHEGEAAARAAAIPTAPAVDADSQMSLFTEFLPHPAIDRLREIDLDALTPLAAFDALRGLVKQAKPRDDA